MFAPSSASCWWKASGLLHPRDRGIRGHDDHSGRATKGLWTMGTKSWPPICLISYTLIPDAMRTLFPLMIRRRADSSFACVSPGWNCWPHDHGVTFITLCYFSNPRYLTLRRLTTDKLIMSSRITGWILFGLVWFLVTLIWDGNSDSKVHGKHMGPIWGRQDPGGPHVGPHEPCYLGICVPAHIWMLSAEMRHTTLCAIRQISTRDKKCWSVKDSNGCWP